MTVLLTETDGMELVIVLSANKASSRIRRMLIGCRSNCRSGLNSFFMRGTDNQKSMSISDGNDIRDEPKSNEKDRGNDIHQSLISSFFLKKISSNNHGREAMKRSMETTAPFITLALALP